MIYVIQSNEYSQCYKPVWAGSSAHEALLAASKLESCRVKLFKNGKRYIVEEKQDKPKDGTE